MDSVEMDTLVKATLIYTTDTIFLPQQQQPQSEPSTINDCDSDIEDEDQVFSDALDYINSDPATTMADATIDPCSANEPKPLWKRVSHNVNTVLLTIGMLIGLTLAYLQWRQQAWSNQMSSVQTCLAMEQASTSSTLNSSFCQSVLQKGIFRRHSVVPEAQAEILLDMSTLSSAIRSTQFYYPLIRIGGVGAIFAFMKKLVSHMRSSSISVTTTDNRGSESLVHVPIHLPRLISTSIETLDADIPKRRVTGLPYDENEHLYYLKAQATLAQEMRGRALSWQPVKSPDRHDNTLEWEDTGIQRTVWNESLEAEHSQGEETTLDRPLSPDVTSESRQAIETAIYSHDALTVTNDPLSENESDQNRRAKKSWRSEMLSNALAEANRAILHENALETKLAIEAYTRARDKLKQVMARTSNPEDKKKLLAIRSAYSRRIWELLEYIAEPVLDDVPPADGSESDAGATIDKAEEVDEDVYDLIDAAVSMAYVSGEKPKHRSFEQLSGRPKYVPWHGALPTIPEDITVATNVDVV